MVFRVEHLVGAGKARLLHGAHVQLADRDDALEHVRLLLGIRLVQHPFVADADGPRLVCIDARDDEDLVRDRILDLSETRDIVDHRVFVISGTGADD